MKLEFFKSALREDALLEDQMYVPVCTGSIIITVTQEMTISFQKYTLSGLLQMYSRLKLKMYDNFPELRNVFTVKMENSSLRHQFKDHQVNH